MPDEHLKMKNSSDERLMEAVRDDRCVRSFEIIVERWKMPIARLCYRMTFCWEDAEDMAQVVFTKLFRNRRRYQPTAKFSTYLWRIAVNCCRDFHRKSERQKRKHNEALETMIGQTTPNLNSNRMESERVRVALEQLSPNHREVLVLRHYEDLKFQEIANVLEIPFGTVASRMAKALKLLGEQLQSDLKT